MLKSVRIISWFGTNDREKRVNAHARQVNWFKERSYEVIVFAQNYNEDEYIPGVRYIKHNGNVMLPGDARNVLLKDFYESDESWSAFADNDSILYCDTQHLDGNEFLSLFNSASGNYDLVDYFIPSDPAQTPFTKFFDDNKLSLSNNFWFSRTHKGKGSFFVLKNLSKFYKKEVYCKQSLFSENGKLISGEDIAFTLDLIQNGFRTYELKNILLNELCRNVSTWNNNVDERKESIIKFREIISNEFDIDCTDKNPKWSSWMKTHSTAPKTHLVSKYESWF